MANVREMKPVGSTNIDTVQRQLAGGYQAQGFALAQTIIAGVVSTAMQLRRATETAFDYSEAARDAAVKALNDWKKELQTAVKANGNLTAGGMTERDAGRIARSAAVRVSEFSAIVKAMNNGMNRDTLREKCGVADPENIGFHTVVEIARQFNQTGANGGRGRPADPFAVKLAKWLASQNPTGEDAEVKAAAVNALANILPLPDDAEGPAADIIKAASTHRRASDTQEA